MWFFSSGLQEAKEKWKWRESWWAKLNLIERNEINLTWLDLIWITLMNHCKFFRSTLRVAIAINILKCKCSLHEKMATTAILLSNFNQNIAVLIKMHFHFLWSFNVKSHFSVCYGAQQFINTAIVVGIMTILLLPLFFQLISCSVSALSQNCYIFVVVVVFWKL